MTQYNNGVPRVHEHIAKIQQHLQPSPRRRYLVLAYAFSALALALGYYLFVWSC